MRWKIEYVMKFNSTIHELGFTLNSGILKVYHERVQEELASYVGTGITPVVVGRIYTPIRELPQVEPGWMISPF